MARPRPRSAPDGVGCPTDQEVLFAVGATAGDDPEIGTAINPSNFLHRNFRPLAQKAGQPTAGPTASAAAQAWPSPDPRPPPSGAALAARCSPALRPNGYLKRRLSGSKSGRPGGPQTHRALAIPRRDRLAGRRRRGPRPATHVGGLATRLLPAAAGTVQRRAFERHRPVHPPPAAAGSRAAASSYWIRSRTPSACAKPTRVSIRAFALPDSSRATYDCGHPTFAANSDCESPRTVPEARQPPAPPRQTALPVERRPHLGVGEPLALQVLQPVEPRRPVGGHHAHPHRLHRPRRQPLPQRAARRLGTPQAGSGWTSSRHRCTRPR